MSRWTFPVFHPGKVGTSLRHPLGVGVGVEAFNIEQRWSSLHFAFRSSPRIAGEFKVQQVRPLHWLPANYYWWPVSSERFWEEIWLQFGLKCRTRGENSHGSWGRCYELRMMTPPFIKPQSCACAPSHIRAVGYSQPGPDSVLQDGSLLPRSAWTVRLSQLHRRPPQLSEGPFRLYRSFIAGSKKSFRQTHEFIWLIKRTLWL